jgi:hypothetical protein
VSPFRLIVALVPVVVLATGGCGGGLRSRSATTKPTPDSPPPAAVAGCARATVRGVESMLLAINSGHAEQADHWVTENEFVWFVLGVRVPGSTLPINRTVQLRTGLLGYLRQRVQEHDQLQLRSIRVNKEVGVVSTQVTLGFEAVIRRRANDLARRRWLPLVAKGEWLCGEDKLRGLAGHADLPGGPPQPDMQCPPSSPVIEGARICA